MCGRFNASLSILQIEQLFHAKAVKNVTHAASYNAAPTEPVPIVIENEKQERTVEIAQFGMPMTAGGKTFPLINLQSEKAANRQDFQERRCLIPAAGFYEWQKVTPKEKQPYYFSPNEGIFAFAGVWKRSKTGLAFSIFTTKANELVEPIHARMPVILSHNAIGAWLSNSSSTDTLVALTESYPANLMQAWKVSKAVNSPKNKDAACINSL